MEGGRPLPPCLDSRHEVKICNMPDKAQLPNVTVIDGPEGVALIEGLLREGTGVRIPIYGRSMRPFLRDGMIATISPIRGCPRMGEIVLYRRDDGNIRLHRVMRIRAGGTAGESRVLLRGDAFGSGAEWLGLELCLGCLRDYRVAGGSIRTNRGWRLATGTILNLAIHLLRRLAALAGVKREPAIPAP